MNIQLLVSTMHQKDISILSKMNVSSDAVVINQCDEENRKEFRWKSFNIIWINTVERGLSKSRNMALQNASADVCVLADDDEVFCDNYGAIVLESFNNNPKCSMIRFQVEGIEKKFKDYPTQQKKIGYMSSMKISSVELAVKREDIIRNRIMFNELIGSGTEFLMGEENAFVFQCLLNSLKGIYIPKKIADLHIGESSWFKGFNAEYFIGRGAAFAAMSSRMAVLFNLQFALRKYCLYKDQLDILEALRYMNYGKKKYIEKKRKLK